jgi:hypothetical protein
VDLAQTPDRPPGLDAGKKNKTKQNKTNKTNKTNKQKHRYIDTYLPEEMPA